MSLVCGACGSWCGRCLLNRRGRLASSQGCELFRVRDKKL